MGALSRLNLKCDFWCQSKDKMFSEYKLKEIKCDMRVYDPILIVRCFVNLGPGANRRIKCLVNTNFRTLSLGIGYPYYFSFVSFFIY